jgi:MOSC domain-containing protein YiiM
VEPGALGENVTTEGLDLGALSLDERLLLGSEVLLEVTDYASPCRTIQRFFVGGRYERASHKIHPKDSRYYARVLRGGSIRVGDPVTIEPTVGSDAARR